MPHSLPELEYPYDALEPHMDALTLKIHHSKHHQAYVDKLNQALEKAPQLQEKSLEELLKNPEIIPEEIRTAVINNGGGHYNHSLFWKVMSPNAKPATGTLKDDIEKKWGSLKEFKKEFTETAIGTFGSGWTWLYLTPEKELEIMSTSNQDTPLPLGKTPIFLIDVWEHAYYLKYQNRRPEFIETWINSLLCGEKAEKIYLDKIK